MYPDAVGWVTVTFMMSESMLVFADEIEPKVLPGMQKPGLMRVSKIRYGNHG